MTFTECLLSIPVRARFWVAANIILLRRMEALALVELNQLGARRTTNQIHKK